MAGDSLMHKTYVSLVDGQVTGVKPAMSPLTSISNQASSSLHQDPLDSSNSLSPPQQGILTPNTNMDSLCDELSKQEYEAFPPFSCMLLPKIQDWRNRCLLRLHRGNLCKWGFNGYCLIHEYHMRSSLEVSEDESLVSLGDGTFLITCHFLWTILPCGFTFITWLSAFRKLLIIGCVLALKHGGQGMNELLECFNLVAMVMVVISYSGLLQFW